MYLPEHFAESSIAEVDHIINANPLAILVAQKSDAQNGAQDNGMEAHHLPLMRQGENTLVGHIAKSNDLHRIVHDGDEVLLIFRGEDSYISPNWYPTKFDHHKHVPTWNYQAVHMYGNIYFSHKRHQKANVVGGLTHRHERAHNSDNPWKMSDAPKDFIEVKLREIVAFRVEITRTLAQSKLSQNKENVDFDNVTEVMTDNHKPQLAKRMNEIKKGGA